MFQQILNPAGNLWLTVSLALLPLVALLVMLAVLRVTAWIASIVGGIITLALGVFVWHAPLHAAVRSYLYGGITGVWSVDWITVWGLIIFNTLVLTGEFDKFKRWMLYHATSDIRVQTIMMAWAFGALLEGLVGFGYPWAVVVPILVGLGISDLDAIRVSALANNAPVSFGALGVPILGLAAVTALPVMALTRSIGNIVAVLALLPPWVLIYLVSGWEGMLEAWPLAILGSLSYIAGQWPVAHFLGPYLPDLTGSLSSFWILFLFVKLWQPKNIRKFGGAIAPSNTRFNSDDAPELGTAWQTFQVWLPYLVLVAVVVAWTGPWSKLPGWTVFKASVSAKSSVTGQPVTSTFSFAPLSGGSPILVSWLLILAILQPSGEIIGEVFRRTFKQMWGALLVGFFMFALAFIFVFTGMANSLAFGLSKIGIFFVVLAPILGWIGVALSGSNTSTNAMFGPVQVVVGRILNFPVLLLPSLNSVGAEVGKPIAPQTASVGVSTSKFVRNEGQVIRHNMGWTMVVLAYLIVIGVIFYKAFPNLMVR